jgi:hypothetical protein
MQPTIERILKRYKALGAEEQVYPWDPYFVHAAIRGKRDALWFRCSRRETVRLEYIDVCGETDAELILSADRAIVDFYGSLDMMGLLVYVAERIVPDLDNRFYTDYDVIRAKQSATYQKLVTGAMDILSFIHQSEVITFRF